MQTSRNRRHRLTAVVMVAALGLSANGLTADASGTHPRSLGSPLTSSTARASLPDKSACVVAVVPCQLFAKPGSHLVGATTVNFWGFTLDNSTQGELAGYVNVNAMTGAATPVNTIIMGETDALTIQLHNELAASAGNLALEFPAVAVPPDVVGVAGPGGIKPYTFPAGSLKPGTYVYEAGATASQARQLSMGLSGIIIVRPTGYHSLPIPITVPLTITPIRTDANAVIAPNTVDANIVNDPDTVITDVGQPVSGPGLPLGTTILSVVAGSQFTMSAAATPTGVTIGSVSDGAGYPRTDASAYVTPGSTTVTDSAITLADEGKIVVGPGVPAGSVVGTGTVDNPTLGTFGLHDPTDTSDVSATPTGVTITLPSHIDPSFTVNGSAVVSDAAVTPADVGAAVTGAGIPLGATIISVGAGQFTMSAAATATSEIAPSTTAYGSAFNAEALVVMTEIDTRVTDPLSAATNDVEDYTPQYFFINGKAHSTTDHIFTTDDIGAMPGNTVLLRAANLGIRDRSLGLLNQRMTVIGDDSQQVTSDHQTGSIESKLLTPGQVADITTIVDPSATVGTQFPVLDLSRHLNNSASSGVGGMLTFIDVVSGPAPAGKSLAKVTNLSPATNDGTQNLAVHVTFSGGTNSAAWFLDTIHGPGHPFAAANGSTTVPITIADVLAEPGALTGDHVIWIQPYSGALVSGTPSGVPGTPSGDVFTLARSGPSISSLATDPHFAHLVFNKLDPNPPGTTDVILTGSAQPSLLDYVIDGAEACFSLPAPAADCPAADQIAVDVGDAVVPSHTQALSARIPVADFPAPGGPNTIYVRVHESPIGPGGADRSSLWGDPNSSVDVVIDTSGPAVTIDTANTAVYAGAGNNPGNLNFLESIRVQVNIADDLSPIADAELFLDTSGDPTGSGAQLRPLAGQWLDDLNATTRTAYIDVPVSELLSRPQGNALVYIHAKDAAGNWGAYKPYTLQLDKTNPVTISPDGIAPVGVDAGSHTFMPDETGIPVLAGGLISITSCDPNGVTAESNCPLPAGTALLAAPPNTPVSSGITGIRYHVSAVTGTIGAAGAGIFYQTSQTADLSAVTPVTNTYNGSTTWSFNWHMIQPSAVPIDGATSVWVWVLDGAGNPSIPFEVVLLP